MRLAMHTASQLPEGGPLMEAPASVCQSKTHMMMMSHNYTRLYIIKHVKLILAVQ